MALASKFDKITLIFIFSILKFTTNAQTNECEINATTIATATNPSMNISQVVMTTTAKPTPPPIIPFLEENIEIKEPISLFAEWFDEANRKKDPDTHLAYLATVSKEGYPSVRPLALIDFDDEGFIFFTNHGSRKAMDIANNPHVAMTMFWKNLQRVVRIEGIAEMLSPEESEPFFRQRPRASQIRILASPQSARIPNRDYVHENEQQVAGRLTANETVPLPAWGGYSVRPRLIEFWQGQRDYVNDRIQFRRYEGVENEADGKLVHLGEDGWVYERLAP